MKAGRDPKVFRRTKRATDGERAKTPEEEKSSHEFELVGKKAGAKTELLL